MPLWNLCNDIDDDGDNKVGSSFAIDSPVSIEGYHITLALYCLYNHSQPLASKTNNFRIKMNATSITMHNITLFSHEYKSMDLLFRL